MYHQSSPVAKTIFAFVAFLLLITIVFWVGSAKLHSGKIYQHHQAAVLVAKHKLVAERKQVVKYREQVADYSNQLKSLTDQYGNSNAFISTVADAGKQQVKDLLDKIDQLDLKVSRLPTDAPNRTELNDEMATLKDTASQWSSAVN